ncbi:MAG: PD-(D/E)XK nuclease family protein [Anaerolineales bacterium]|nr:PD-(D/E)XK nuclease family protein [Anaerolineales bacterium]
MKSPANLFISLHHWASRQDENFTTESFAYLLRYLQDSEERVFLRILSKLSDELINLGDRVSQIEISTQSRLENTIQDIQIKSPEKLIFVEIKFSSKLTSNQVFAYLELLRKSGYKNESTKLVCLTRSPISSDITQGAFPLRWYQIAEWLEQELNSVDKEVSRFLIKNFIEFLKYQRATLLKVSSPISEGLSNYRNNVDKDSVLYNRFKSLDKLVVINELIPLYEFMLLLFESIKTFVDEAKIKFDSTSDKSGDGSVIYNISNGEYFVWVEYNNPEILKFSTYTRIADKEQDYKELGKTLYEQKYKIIRWRNDFKVPQHFFELNKDEQVNFLIKVVKENLEFARLITKQQDRKN